LFLKNFFRKTPDKAHELIIENNTYFSGVNLNRPLHDYEFIAFDTELTGLDPKQDEIIAIGGVRIKNLQICCGETFYALIKPTSNIHTPSTLVHRITPQELQEAKPLEDVLPEFLHFCGKAFLVGHYVGLDLGFMNRSAQNLLGGVIKTHCLDTMRLAMAYNEFQHGTYYDHYATKYNLAALTKEFNLPQFTEHNALQDSMQTAYLFLYLLKKMQRQGLRTMKHYLKAGRKWKITY